MRYLLLAAICLASFYPPVWARDLNATEKEMAGSWIETSRYSDRMELFEDGTGKGVLGDSFEWKILADNRLKADAPGHISTSEPVDLREGFFYLEGREFIRYDPALEATYIELSRAVQAAADTNVLLGAVPEWLGQLDGYDDGIRDPWKRFGGHIGRFRGTVSSVRDASQECLTRSDNALRRSPGFPRAELVETDCRYNDIKYLELQSQALDKYPKAISNMALYFSKDGSIHRQEDKPDTGADLGEIWLGFMSIVSLPEQRANGNERISFYTERRDHARQELESLERAGPVAERGHGKNAAKQRSERIAYWKSEIASAQREIDEFEQKSTSIRAELDQKRAAIPATLAKQKKDQIEAIVAAYGRALTAGLPPPRKAETLNALALIYATTDVPEVSDGTKAVDYAKQALTLFPNSPTYSSTLAVAHARAGDFAEAARVQQQAIDLLSPAASQDAERTAQQGRLDLYRQGKSIGGPSRSP
jgi:tetratricopeptide (TPR) repeat protein